MAKKLINTQIKLGTGTLLYEALTSTGAFVIEKITKTTDGGGSLNITKESYIPISVLTGYRDYRASLWENSSGLHFATISNIGGPHVGNTSITVTVIYLRKFT